MGFFKLIFKIRIYFRDQHVKQKENQNVKIPRELDIKVTFFVGDRK